MGCWRRGKDLMWPDAGLSSLDFFVKSEPFCGDIKPVERPESRVEGRAREMAAKKHKKREKEMRGDPPTGVRLQGERKIILQ